MFDELSSEWSRPQKIARLFRRLGREVPQRLRRERFLLLLDDLKSEGVEAVLADYSKIDIGDSPGIDAKLRLRRASNADKVNSMAKSEFGYEIMERVGGSAMADCFKVRGEGGQFFFLKKVRVGGVDERPLERELAIYSRLERASLRHVLKFVEHKRDAEFVGLVLEFADGGSLKEWREESPRTESEIKAACLEVADGLASLHALGVVHRDVKPANIVRVGDAWKLADFGISKNLSRLVTSATMQGAGTRGYAAPEQWQRREAHASADVYSFGKLIVFLLEKETDVDLLMDRPRWHDLVRACTCFDAERRVSIEQACEMLQAL